MVSQTIYLHPRRTLVASWDTDADMPCLVEYCEYSPEIELSGIISPCNERVIVAGTDHWFAHSYPSAAGVLNPERVAFEFEHVCGVPSHTDLDMHLSIGLSSGVAWNTVIGVYPDTIPGIRHLVGPHVKEIISDLATDIRTALACTPPQGQHWALHGRRGAKIITVVISPDHIALYAVVRQESHNAPYQQAVLSDLAALRLRFELDVRHVMLFGDFLTMSMLGEVRSALRGEGVKSARLQPFRSVATSIDLSVADKILSRAHVIAPIMASVVGRITLA